MAEAHQLNPGELVAAVADGVEAGSRETGVGANLIGIISRTYGPDTAWHELECMLPHRDRIAALDLAGDEANFPAELFVEHFRKATAAGWQITAHAGESAGPESIWQAIRLLGATRIGHAVHAPEDPALIEYMRENPYWHVSPA
jgi:adenosine deaminase